MDSGLEVKRSQVFFLKLTADQGLVFLLDRDHEIAPLHQTPSCRIPILFVTHARDSKVRLLAGYANTGLKVNQSIIFFLVYRHFFTAFLLFVLSVMGFWCSLRLFRLKREG